MSAVGVEILIIILWYLHPDRMKAVGITSVCAKSPSPIPQCRSSRVATPAVPFHSQEADEWSRIDYKCGITSASVAVTSVCHCQWSKPLFLILFIHSFSKPLILTRVVVGAGANPCTHRPDTQRPDTQTCLYLWEIQHLRNGSNRKPELPVERENMQTP